MRFFPLLIVIILQLPLQAQEIYWVYFDKKPPLNQKSISEAFSLDGIQRREIQKIPFTSEDIRVDKTYLTQLKGIEGLKLKSTSKWFNAAFIEVDQENTKEEILNLPFVKGVRRISRNTKTYKKASKKLKVVENKTKEAFNSSVYGGGLNQLELYNLMPLHEEGYKGESIKIGVFDAGFFGTETMMCFDSLFNQNKVLGTYDLVDGDDSVYEKHTHGTYVLSCISANLPNTLIGGAPDASVYLFRTEDGASETLAEEFYWVKAAEMADSLGINIINSSLGYTVFDDTTENHTYKDMDGNSAPITIGADIAAQKGILVVSSAGNQGNSGWRYISAPADGDSVLTVGAVNDLGTPSGFSSYGPTYDGRIKPNVCAVGEGSAVYSFNDEVIHFNGTSFSSPLLAAAAASLWSKFPTASNMEVLKAIEESSDRYLNPDDRCGYGIPDFKVASQTLGTKHPIFTKDELLIYPNPAKENLKLQFYGHQATEGTIRIVDYFGRVVFEQNSNAVNGINSMELKLPSINNGIYVVEVYLDKEITYQKKVVISNN